jgi:hypothetical protein
MEHETTKLASGKSQRRSASKTASRSSGMKVRSTIHLSTEASQRLDIHTTMMGMDRSSLVEKLINESLRRWIVSDRGGADSSTGPPENEEGNAG